MTCGMRRHLVQRSHWTQVWSLLRFPSAGVLDSRLSSWSSMLHCCCQESPHLLYTDASDHMKAVFMTSKRLIPQLPLLRYMTVKGSLQ